MKMIELILDDDEAIGVEAISVVENPAIESDFIAQGKDCNAPEYWKQGIGRINAIQEEEN